MATAAVALVLVVVATGRYNDGQAHANDAAYAAARAASLVVNPALAASVGRQAAVDALEETGKSCRNLTVSFGGSDFTPGGQVVAEVSCTVSLADTGSLGIKLGLKPATRFTQHAVVPIESYRD
jgi:hypothetical protein